MVIDKGDLWTYKGQLNKDKVVCQLRSCNLVKMVLGKQLFTFLLIRNMRKLCNVTSFSQKYPNINPMSQKRGYRNNVCCPCGILHPKEIDPF